MLNAAKHSGWTVKRLPYTDDKGIEKVNLIALAGAEFSNKTEVELTLVGHTDTVPYDPNWIEAFKLTEHDGKLYGRGACDTKAFIAASLHAVEAIALEKFARPLALIFTADEEIGLIGAKRLAQLRPLLLVTRSWANLPRCDRCARARVTVSLK